MDESEEPIEIRTFANPDEVWGLPGFKHDKPINKDNYSALLGDYRFPDEVHCCFQKDNGNLCGEGHKYGFVAKLIDDSITIIGNSCAKNKFGADSKLKVDRAKYLNEKRRRERLAQLAELIKERDGRLNQLSELRLQLSALKGRIDELMSKLGATIQQRLEYMARTRNASVTITGVSYREYKDEDGQTKKERLAAQSRLGIIEGIECVNEASYKEINSAIRNVIQAYEMANEMGHDIKLSELERITSSINDSDRIVQQGNELLKRGVEFFSTDMTLLCFITSDKAERYKVARLALDQQGIDAGKEKAKAWLVEQERRISSSLNVDKIEIK
jgi:hypothetical protein